MKSKPAVSVIIPAYNEEERIGGTLRAVRRLGCDEVIVVDDGSRDQTAAIAGRYADQVIRLAKHRGKGAALAEGIRVDKGESLMVLDDDLSAHARLSAPLLVPDLQWDAEMSIGRFP